MKNKTSALVEYMCIALVMFSIIYVFYAMLVMSKSDMVVAVLSAMLVSYTSISIMEKIER